MAILLFKNFTRMNTLQSLSANNCPRVRVSDDLGEDVGDGCRSVKIWRCLPVGLVLGLSDGLAISSVTWDLLLGGQLYIHILKTLLLLFTGLLSVTF